LGLGFGMRQPTIALDDASPLVEEDPPVLGRPAVITAAGAVGTELDSGRPHRLQSFSRTHILTLQPATVFSTDWAEGGEGVKGGDLRATARHAVRPSASAC
jgi:hypothetical protein